MLNCIIFFNINKGALKTYIRERELRVVWQEQALRFWWETLLNLEKQEKEKREERKIGEKYKKEEE